MMIHDWIQQLGSADWSQESLTQRVELAERARTRAELAPLFQVGKVKQDAPENFVSPEEFERLVGDFSRIRLGQTDLRVDTTGLGEREAAAYQEAAYGDLAAILQTAGGRELIRGLAYDDQDQTTTLRPCFKQGDPALGRDLSNAKAEPDHLPWDQGVLGPNGVARAGVNAQVLINPELGPAPGSVQPDDDWMPMRSDVTLYHELMHAWDLVHGTLAATPSDASDGVHPDDARAHVLRSEYVAAGLGTHAGADRSENAYRAARAGIAEGGVGLRPGDRDMEDRDTYVTHY